MPLRTPTVPVVCPTAEDTVLVAALIRALVATMIDDERAAAPVENVRDCVLSAAHWRAAHEGLDGTLVDLRLGGVLRPAWEVVDELVATVSPALLRHGDIEPVVAQLARLREHGTGAARQRRIHRRTADINAVLADLARQTIAQ
jgi:gamma-glutamyl:cysteine ligase YbdK (ATP-grasp superfamily)